MRLAVANYRVEGHILARYEIRQPLACPNRRANTATSRIKADDAAAEKEGGKSYPWKSCLEERAPVSG